MSQDITAGVIFDTTPQHYITFGDFNSRIYNLHMGVREFPTPDEKHVIKSLPYMQGVIDLSTLRGCRTYENRTGRYVFYRFRTSQNEANRLQTDIENLLMGPFNTELNDTFEPNYHYIGKCQSVVTEHDYEYDRLIIEITFDLYCFKAGNTPVGRDLWDPFNFSTDAFQTTSFEVPYAVATNIILVNTGQNVVSPTISVSEYDAPDDGGYFQIRKGGVTYTFQPGESSPKLRLDLGENKLTMLLTVPGTVTVSFLWYRELI